MASPAESLAAAFERQAQTELPPDGVDVALAVAHGRRTVRKRRTAVSMAMTGALAAVAALAWTAAAHGPGHAVGPVAPAPAPAPSTASAAPTVTTTQIFRSGPNGPDPLTVQASFGWLPPGMPISGYGANPDADWTEAGAALGPGGTVVSTMVQLMTEATDSSDPTTAPPDPADVVPNQTLNGHPVEFKQVDSASAGSLGSEYLTWLSPSGQQVWLFYSFKQNQAPGVDVLMHMARTVTYGTAQVPLPVSVAGLAGAGHGLIVENIGAFQMHEPSQVTLDDDGMTIGVYYGLFTLNDLPGYGMGTTEYAWATRTVGGVSVAVVIRNDDGTSPPDTSKLGTAQQILDRVTYYGSDQTAWTTDVLRN
ncbi:MAG TPA: hypothetical protein VGX23_37995 [Actinocrinis sp.]|nr:hypothetical protein [Actinocrinis sp.]